MKERAVKERAVKERAVKKDRAVITVNGIDHSGIIAAITRALADLDVNIEDHHDDRAGLVHHDPDRRHHRPRPGPAPEEDGGRGQAAGRKITVQHEDIFKYMHRV